MGQFTSNRSMKKFSVIVTLLAAICLPVLANDPEIPSCDELKQINPNFECDGDDGDMHRNFPGAALHSDGNHHGGWFGAGIIYDPECRKWLSVDLADCPIAFNFPLFEDLCNARKWWWSLGTQTKRVAVLDASGDGQIPVNIHSTRLALFLEVLVLGYVVQEVVMAVLMVLVMALHVEVVIMAVHVETVMSVPKPMG